MRVEDDNWSSFCLLSYQEGLAVLQSTDLNTGKMWNWYTHIKILLTAAYVMTVWIIFCGTSKFHLCLLREVGFWCDNNYYFFIKGTLGWHWDWKVAKSPIRVTIGCSFGWLVNHQLCRAPVLPCNFWQTRFNSA